MESFREIVSLTMPTVTKVCQFISGDLWAGAEAMVYSLLKGLQKYNELELSAILLNEGRLSDELRYLKIPIVILKEKEKNNIQILKMIKNHIHDHSLDIIHSHRYKENILSYLSTRCKQPAINLVATQHGVPEFYDSKRNMKYYLFNKINFSVLSSYFKAVVAVSDDIHETMVHRYGFSNGNVYTVHNGIDTAVHKKKANINEYFYVGSMGRIYPVKNFSLMVEIANETKKLSDKIRFELAGDGPDMESIKKLVYKYKLENIFSLKGFVKRTDDFYNQLDVYLNTSLHEGFPMGVLEAMAHGLPVVAPNVGGIKEILENGVHGYVIDDHSPKVYAERIYYLYRNRSTMIDMSNSARRRVNMKFTFDRMANEYYRLYQFVKASRKY